MTEINKFSSPLKSRTPSGTTISNSFGDLRSIFSPEGFKTGEQLRQLSSSTSSLVINQPWSPSKDDLTGTGVESAISGARNKGWFSQLARCESDPNPICLSVNKQKTATIDTEDFYFTPPATPVAKKRKTKEKSPSPRIKASESIIKFVKPIKMIESGMDQTTNTSPKKMDTNISSPNAQPSNPIADPTSCSQSMTTSQHEEVKTLSLQSVMSMFKRLEGRIISVEEQVATNNSTQQTQISDEQPKQRFEELIAELEVCKTEIDTLRRRNYLMKCANKVAFNSIDELSKRVNNLEMDKTRRMVSIHGLYIYHEKKDEVSMEVEVFLCEQVGVSVNVDDVYFLGSYEPRICIVSFATLQDKRKVMNAKSALKDVINRDKKPIFINDFKSTEINERRKYEGEIYQENEAQPTHLKFKSEFKGTALMLNDVPCAQMKRVSTPSPSALIDISLDELDEVLSVSLSKSVQIEYMESRFIAYAQDLKNVSNKYQQIQRAYLRVKLLHPSAQHVICAYDVDEQDIFAKDYCDDGEHGAGRAALNYLAECNVKDTACFIVRYYGGHKIGQQRFQCINSAIASSILEMRTKGLPPQQKSAIQPEQSRSGAVQQPMAEAAQQPKAGNTQQNTAQPPASYSTAASRGAFNPMRGARPSPYRQPKGRVRQTRSSSRGTYRTRGGRPLPQSLSKQRGNSNSRGRYNTWRRGKSDTKETPVKRSYSPSINSERNSNSDRTRVNDTEDRMSITSEPNYGNWSEQNTGEFQD